MAVKPYLLAGVVEVGREAVLDFAPATFQLELTSDPVVDDAVVGPAHSW